VLGVFTRLFLFVHQALFSLVNLGFGLATMALLFDSYRKARVTRLKRQLGVITLGLSACLICYSFATSIRGSSTSASTRAALGAHHRRAHARARVDRLLDRALQVPRHEAAGAARHRLRARHRPPVGIYLGVVSRSTGFLAQATGTDARVFEPVFLVMALALFQPRSPRLEEILDQMLLKDPSDYRNVVRQLGRELQTTIDLEVLLSRTIHTLAEALILARAHIVAFTREGVVARTGVGEPLSDTDLRRLGRSCHASRRGRPATG